MLLVYCGNNIQNSRKEYLDKIDEYKEKGYEIIHLASTDFEHVESAINAHSSLFNDQLIFTGDNILKYKMLKKNVLSYLKEHSHVSFIFWEEFITGKDISKTLKQVQVIDVSLPGTIWKLLDSLVPGNAAFTLKLIRDVYESTDEYMILYMMQKHIKDLILVLDGESTRNVAPWQQSKLKSQASKWKRKNLESFFIKLHDVETQTKQGTMQYGILEAIDILITVYLQ